MESIIFCTGAFTFLFDENSISAPMRLAALASISWPTLSLSEYTATSTAIPRIIEERKRKSLPTLRRPSRQAIVSSQENGVLFFLIGERLSHDRLLHLRSFDRLSNE